MLENVSDALLLLKNIFWLKDTLMYIGKNNNLSVNWEMKIQTIVVEDTIEGKMSYDLVVVKTRSTLNIFRHQIFFQLVTILGWKSKIDSIRLHIQKKIFIRKR